MSDSHRLSVLFVGSASHHLVQQVQGLGHETLVVENSSQALAADVARSEDALFVLNDFMDETGVHNRDLEKLRDAKRCVCGITALRQSIGQNEPLTQLQKELIHKPPQFSLFLKGLIICVEVPSEKRERSVINRYLRMIRYMGGRSREPDKIRSPGTNFLITPKGNNGSTYRWALLFGVPVLRIGWIDHLWHNRFDPDFNATAPDVIDQFTVKPFDGLSLAFMNFDSKDEDAMHELVQQTLANGGKCVDSTDPTCTHIVVDAIVGDDTCLSFDPDKYSNLENTFVVYKEWFWSSILVSGREDESSFAFPAEGCKKSAEKKVDRSGSRMSVDTMCSPGLEYSMSFTSPLMSYKSQFDSPFTKPIAATKRYNVCDELLDKERNYVNILEAIIGVSAEPLCQTLDKTELDTIFGKVQPLKDTHKRLLDELQELIEKNWQEHNRIGRVFVKHGESLLKAYNAFVMFSDDAKAMISECESKYPKFRAFLKKCESRPQCRRQSLRELLISPVQQVPRYIILLKQILEHTDDSNPDKADLRHAIDKIEKGLETVNEEIGEKEEQLVMFEIVNDIEGAPALLSAKRRFRIKVDAKLVLSDDNAPVFYKGHTLTLFLFNDCIEICKKRTVKRSNSLTSAIRSSAKSEKSGSSKPLYRHIDTLNLSSIKYLHEFDDVENGLNNAVWIQSLDLTDDGSTHKQYPFVLTSDRHEFVHEFRKNYHRHRPDGEIFSNKPHDQNFRYAKSLAEYLSKSSFDKAKEKVCRTMSMNRRQSVSTANLMIPQFSRSTLPQSPACSDSSYLPPQAPQPATNHMSTVPRSRLKSRFFNTISSSLLGSPLSGRKISSSTLCLNDLSEFEERSADDTFSLPSTPAPRKKKCPTSVPTTPFT